ncbi:hypothetical protein G5B37_10190 [Rasiella rasia]|uniref:Phytanoyl-CoA dioxygenase n=1 Tax=Rasiella rasia TaxID=2744027 RepID=A0A6G6GN52_9FLAO|nr:hypothetical protein [Rasiella rasia]QIE59920.1 hypothetical protein G5B37_10190 [Rasiella rasia]
MTLIEKVQRRIRNFGPYHNYLKRKFYKPDEEFKNIDLSPTAKKWYDDLSENGIIKIEDTFEWVSDIFKESYFQQKENKYFLKDLVDDRSQKTGRVFAQAVSLEDPKLRDWYYNEDLFAMLAKMYQRQPYYRNQPMVQTYAVSDENENDIAGKWHIDGGLNQITFMLLVNDIDTSGTHMQYALKSTHDDNKELDRWNIQDHDIENKFEIMHCIGKAGTLYVFQGGLGYHRAVYKPSSTRSVYHANFTTGHDVKNYHLEQKSVIENGKKEPFFMKDIAKKII